MPGEDGRHDEVANYTHQQGSPGELEDGKYNYSMSLGSKESIKKAWLFKSNGLKGAQEPKIVSWIVS